MKVSIIIPVYNAGSFVEIAVKSALAQPETAEVILIEDGSPDNSLAVCQELVEKHEKVRLLRHPGGKNNGAAASRNLGMQNAHYDYIAFLDADDYYLPGRFKITQEVFMSTPDCDGVYEAMGIHFESDCAKEQWLNSRLKNEKLTTMTEIIQPENLFMRLLKSDVGHIHLNGLVLKRTILEKTGYMHKNINLHEDTDFILRLSAVARLVPGQLDEPVTIRRVHQDNRISVPRSKNDIYIYRVKMWRETYNWFGQNNLNDQKQIVMERTLHYCAKSKPLPVLMLKFPYEAQQLIRLLLFPVDYPLIVAQKSYWKKILSIQLWPVFKRNIRKIRFF